MASITQNRKDGRIISYKFRACVARDDLSKQIFKCCTWKVPNGMTPSKAEKAAQKVAAQWERKVKAECINSFPRHKFPMSQPLQIGFP